MDMKEKLLAEMEQSDFAKNNGKIMRTLNVLAPSYHNLSSIQRILKDDGIGEGQYAACLDFLALEGYILLRTVKDHVRGFSGPQLDGIGSKAFRQGNARA